ncbi:MAG: chorismate synthase [Methanomassiliicoccales archaeon]
MNTIGREYRTTIFGASHGPCVGCLIDGCPPNLRMDMSRIEEEMALRRPKDLIGTPRREEDRVEVIAGVKDGVTTGTPVVMTIPNRDVDSSKYELFSRVPRPGHADYPALMRYGRAHDIRGGGQFSGRMTAALVAAGALTRDLLEEIEVEIGAYTVAIGKVQDREERDMADARRARGDPLRAAPEVAEGMREEILRAREEGDSVGGVVRCLVEGLPPGIGEPFFDTLDGEMGKMMLSLPGVKGVEFGSGFRAASMRGSEHNDPYAVRDGTVITTSNHAGGVLGGLSSGMPLDFRVAFKPTASIAREQASVDLTTMRGVPLRIEGRHDPCIVPRAVAVVEAAAALVVADLCVRGGLIG